MCGVSVTEEGHIRSSIYLAQPFFVVQQVKRAHGKINEAEQTIEKKEVMEVILKAWLAAC